MTESTPRNQNSESTTPSLAGRVALVTGAAKRVGAAIVKGLHAQGVNVAIHCRQSQEEANALRDALNRERRDSAIVIVADLLDADSLPSLVGATLTAFGRLDILVNNASTFYPTPLGTITTQQWDDLIGSNLRAPLFLAQAAEKALRSSRGLIVNMIDIHAQRPLPKHPVYSTAKAGLVMLTRSLARELSPEVRVNGIAPGPVMWPEGGIDPTVKAEIIDKTLLKRSGSPEDIMRAVLFFAKDAPYVTGQILAVDGGRSVGW
jgi:pteridine reductase